MAFSEAQKVRIRKRAHLRCCLCHSLGVDIHHVVPQAEGGSDDDDNGAPLCPSCHEAYGANPVKRKFIREARDLWYEICSTRFASDTSSQLAAISDALRALATKEDVERLAVQNAGYVLGISRGLDGPSPAPGYSFQHDEFVHPLVVRELLGWLSDPGPTVLAVDLTAANRSNRFFGDYSRRVADGRIWIEWAGGEQESFGYAHVGTSGSGVHMVECYDCGGGTGVFGSVGLFSVEQDRALVELDGRVSSRARVLLKIVGAVPLGDRYQGRISYENGLLSIGPDKGWFEHGDGAAKTVAVR